MFALLWLVPHALSAAPWPDLSEPPMAGGGQQDAAVIVAIEDYAFVSDVPGAQQNGQDWYRYLTKGRGLKPGRVKLLTNQQASREEILLAAEQMADAVRPGGTLWFVFVGHGAPSQDGHDGLLLGNDVNQTAVSIYSRGLPQSELIGVLEEGRQEATVLLLDACFSGRTGNGDAIAAGLQPLVPTDSAPSSQAIVLSAGRSDEFAGPLPGGGRPAFSYLALGALYGWGDADQDGYVSAGEVQEYTLDALRAVVSGRSQTPQLSGSDRPIGRARESGPDLASIRLSLDGAGDRTVTATNSSSAADTALAELRELATQEAALLQRQQELQAQLAQQAQQESQALQEQAARQWPEFRALADQGGAAGQAALKRFIELYEEASVTVGGQSHPVRVPQVAEAQAMLRNYRADTIKTCTLTCDTISEMIATNVPNSTIVSAIENHGCVGDGTEQCLIAQGAEQAIIDAVRSQPVRLSALSPRSREPQPSEDSCSFGAREINALYTKNTPIDTIVDTILENNCTAAGTESDLLGDLLLDPNFDDAEFQRWMPVFDAIKETGGK